jgi:hypothetical protein
VRPFGFVRLGYLVRRCHRLSFTVIIKVVSKSWRIQCFMTSESILRSGTTSFVTGFREGKFSCSMYLQMTKLHIFSPRTNHREIMSIS